MIAKLHAEGHDVIVERYEVYAELDVVVPVLAGDDPDPAVDDSNIVEMPGDEGNFRSYEEKRGSREGPKERLVAMRNPVMTRKIREFTRRMLPELWPFDYYGPVRIRLYTPTTGDGLFMEVNLSCNLWSRRKTVSGWFAQLAGLTTSAEGRYARTYRRLQHATGRASSRPSSNAARTDRHERTSACAKTIAAGQGVILRLRLSCGDGFAFPVEYAATVAGPRLSITASRFAAASPGRVSCPSGRLDWKGSDNGAVHRAGMQSRDHRPGLCVRPSSIAKFLSSMLRAVFLAR